ncbi:Hypothetical_protein [Hexamita inflata]|uniref:Hypothetical_protein n=1 Tax=Hexamita inflata TaxID=28002 RepID=A0AA86PC36_9EUKA|nr:Hypothetical protein HINF_LOCUS23735 [Hexamita inflata]
MQFLQLTILDLTIAGKVELVDCYTAASSVRFVSIRGSRSFRLYLTPTGKAECSQLPRGINVTVFATKLVDGSNNFIPNSYTVFNFNYSSTIGINVPCTQCVDDNYLASDQVIVTMESAIHFTRLVMGAAQTAKGLQLNCFIKQSMLIDFDYITVTVSPSDSCTQLLTGTVFKPLESADAFLVYQNGDIDRFEKLVVGTDIFTFRTVLPGGIVNYTYNISKPDIGRKPMLQDIQFLQLQLYFVNPGVPLVVPVQIRRFTYAYFPKAYSQINMKVQNETAYFDLQVSNALKSPGLMLYQDYNNQLNSIKPDIVEMQFYGYSNTSTENTMLDEPFVTDTSVTLVGSAPMSFKMNFTSFKFQNQTIMIKCDQSSDCEANFQRYLSATDTSFQYNLLLKLYKNGALIQTMNQKINKATDSCFYNAVGVVQNGSINIQMQQNKYSLNCGIIEKQLINMTLNLSSTDDNGVTQIIQLNYLNVSFKYNMTLAVADQDVSKIYDYISNATNKSQIIQFVSKGISQDYLALDSFYQQTVDAFKQSANLAIIIMGCVSVMICIFITLVPLIQRKISQVIVQRKQLRSKIVGSQQDKYDL